jgi:hypothetical protein
MMMMMMMMIKQHGLYQQQQQQHQQTVSTSSSSSSNIWAVPSAAAPAHIFERSSIAACGTWCPIAGMSASSNMGSTTTCSSRRCCHSTVYYTLSGVGLLDMLAEQQWLHYQMPNRC